MFNTIEMKKYLKQVAEEIRIKNCPNLTFNCYKKLGQDLIGTIYVFWYKNAFTNECYQVRFTGQIYGILTRSYDPEPFKLE